MPQALCQAPVCSRSLHHVCQAEFEERHKALIGEVRVMNKRCLPCLLNQQQCDAATSARLILESNVSEAAVVTPARTRSATKGKRAMVAEPTPDPNAAHSPTASGRELRATARAARRDISAVTRLDFVTSPAETVSEPTPEVGAAKQGGHAMVDSEGDDAPPPKKAGGQKGQRRKPEKRVALTIEQQARILRRSEDSAEPRLTHSELALWAKQEFKLNQAPSRAYVVKMFKNKSNILSIVSSTGYSKPASKALSRKRARHVNSEGQRVLEQHLVEWVQHHDSTHGGRVRLSDNMIRQQVSHAKLCFSEPSIFYCLL